MTAGNGPTISIIDYGVVNLGSIRNMLRKLGFDVELVSTAEGIASAEKMILPGVGAFDHGMSALDDLGLTEPLREKARDGTTPLLGICLGMQLLGQSSEEGVSEGLSIIPGRCVRFKFAPGSGLKVPHMGWNEPHARPGSPLFAGLGDRARFYFTHSYHFVCSDPEDIVATAHHGSDFTAAIQRGNVMGVQFHPEKSHRFGMALLRNFGTL